MKIQLITEQQLHRNGTMGGNPTTGDATPYVILAVTVAAAAGVMVVAFKRRKA